MSADAELLRADALDALGMRGDARAREVLETAEIAIEPIAKWEGTAGTMVGHRVTLAVDAAILARASASPATADALHACIAAAIAGAPREALSELRLRWATHAPPAKSAYRGVVPGPREAIPWQKGIVAYLRAAGEERAANVVARAGIDVTRGREKAIVVVRIADEEALDAEVFAQLAACVGAMLGTREVVEITRERPPPRPGA